MILRDGNERLILNMRHDTSSYSKAPHQESINMIDVYNFNFTGSYQSIEWQSHSDFGTRDKSSSSPTLTSIEESDLIWEEFEAYLASSTTSSSPGLPISETSDYFLEEFVDELAFITFSPGNDDLPFDIEFDLREIEFLLNHDPIKEMDFTHEDLVDKILLMTILMIPFLRCSPMNMLLITHPHYYG
ncbi:hypothetical protein Tco_0120413, partial [Tanacetum coccineum]